MNKLLVLVVIVAIWGSASANQVTDTGNNNAGGLNGFGPWQTGEGGEFTFATDAQLASILGPYAGSTRNWAQPGTFQSFCVELNEFIYPNSTYDVVLNNQSVFTGKPLTGGAAWLYSQFARGGLTGYDYTTLAGRHNSADLLQHAIWHFMGQGNLDLSNPYENLAYTTLGASSAEAAVAGGTYGVYVLNLWQPGHVGQVGYQAQDMLVFTPDGGATVVLLGLGLLSLEALRRRFVRN